MDRRELECRLTAEELEEIKKVLLDKRRSLLEEATEPVATAVDERPPDDADIATSEYELSFELRLRDRNKGLLRKIDKALERIDAGEYDLCESCGNPIGKKRLFSRPETTMCIACKEEQERQEKMYQKKRRLRATLDL